MEMILVLIIGSGLIIFFTKVVKFNKKMMAIENEHFVIYSERDLIVYREYLMCQIIKKYPNISDKEKVKVVIEVIRKAAKKSGNGDYLLGTSKAYPYVFTSYIERLKEIEQELKNENPLDFTNSFSAKASDRFLKAIVNNFPS